jgi:hypothetical protein
MTDSYKKPIAKKLYVAYDIEDADDLLAFRTPEKAAEDTDIESEQVYGVYEFVGLVKLERKTKIVVTKV